MKRRSFLSAFFGFVLLAACAPGGGQGSVQLTPEEVKATFIGTPWHGPGGAFLFREDGTYTYQDFDARAPRGTWAYSMESDGTLRGATTTYTFFKSPTGFSYYHSRSGRTYNAIPNRTAPFVN